jgi:hypothetical protein
MGSWRDAASPQAQQDLDGLLDAALGFAQQQLDRRGEFFPYAAAIGTDGAAEMIAARPDPHDEHPRSADVIEACVAALVSQRDHIRAGAVVADVHLPELGGDAIRVELEHSDGHALTVVLPYAKKRLRKGIEYGQLRAQAGRRRIWA